MHSSYKEFADSIKQKCYTQEPSDKQNGYRKIPIFIHRELCFFSFLISIIFDPTYLLFIRNLLCNTLN